MPERHFPKYYESHCASDHPDDADFAVRFSRYSVDPIYQGATIVIILVFSTVGAFDSAMIDGFFLRAAFWGPVIYAMLALIIAFSVITEPDEKVPFWQEILRAALVGTVVALSLGAPTRLYLSLFTDISATFSDIVETTMKQFAIMPLVSMLVTYVCLLNQKAVATANALVPQDPDAEQIESATRVPVYLEAEDHYIKRVFDDHADIRRMTLKQAADELDGHGLRVHRSYWVKLSAIDACERDGRQLFVRLTSGERIPVGRSSESAVLQFLRDRNAG